MLIALAFLGPMVLLVAAVALTCGLARLPRGTRLADDACPTVSVLVSCRNEERDLPRCIASLRALDYPDDKLEVWLVDDRSTDGTRAVIEAACASSPRFHGGATAGATASHLRAKAAGVAWAARRATGEWLAITDADAAVHPQWLRTMLSHAGPGVGAVSGANFATPTSLVGVIERATLTLAMAFPFGAAGLGGQVVPLGPCMAVRRDAYLAGGGLEAVRVRVAEDVGIGQLVERAGLRSVASADPETCVVVTPVPTLSHLVSQLRRWLAGGISDAPRAILLAAQIVAAYAFLSMLAIVVCLLVHGAIALVAWSVVAVAELILLVAVKRRFGLTAVLRFFPVSFVYSSLVFFLLPPSLVVSSRIVWRGEGYALELPPLR